MTACPLFVELCAGTAAVSLRLARARARPPVSRMGSKSGYADALLGLAGLRPGQGAGHYLWCEPDPGCRLLLEAYRDASLARAAADIIRGWAGEDPRALWERLRAEGPPRGPEASPGGQVFAHEVARWAQLTASNRLINVAWNEADRRWTNTGAGGTTFGGAEFCTPPGRTADALDAAPSDLSATIAPDARAVDPREVARWRVLAGWAYRQGEPGSGFAESRTPYGSGAGKGDPVPHMADRIDRLPELLATILPDAHAADPGPALPAGTVAILDPPYSDVAPMIPPVLAAQFLPLDACGREEGDAALRASGLDHLREPVAHLRVAVLEVLRAAGVQAKVLDTVVERVVIDVVDDLVWSQFASDVALHDKAMLTNAPAVTHEEPVPVLSPALALAGAAKGRLGLDFGGDLRQFALRCQAQPGAAAKFSQAVTWAGCALSGRRTPCAREGGSADLAGDLERHCLLRLRVRLDTNTHIRLPGRKTTGYAHDLPRADVVAIARRWAAAGALVMVCEQEPIPELLADGWLYRDIAHARKGQARTFSRQSREVVTMSRAPVHVPAEQVGLFGGAR